MVTSKFSPIHTAKIVKEFDNEIIDKDYLQKALTLGCNSDLVVFCRFIFQYRN
jgi:hypothetical protein